LGIGSSALAAIKCGIKRFVGFDISSEYIAVARKALLKGATEPTPRLLRRVPRRRKNAQGTEDFLFVSQELD
jgi:hypothetical protein